VQTEMRTDVVIVGGGPGGATAALCLEALGLSSIIVEKEDFPRFHVGESMTGEAAAILRRLGLGEKMAQLHHPVKNATDVYGANGGNKFKVPVMARSSQGDLTASTTWQVRRSEFDKMLLEEAADRGVGIVPGTAKDPIFNADGTIGGIEVEQADGTIAVISGSMVFDASGRGTWGSRVGLTGEKGRGNYAAQTAVFGHVKGAIRDDDPDSGNTIIFYSDHLHWAWFIPIDDEVTSVGVVASNEYLKAFEGDLEAYYASEIASLNPELARRLLDVTMVEPVRTTANFSYEISDYASKGYIAIGDAHRFIDPIFSFGLFVTMAEAELAANAAKRYIDGEGEAVLAEHLAHTERGQLSVQLLVDGFWANPLAFGYMLHHSSYADELIDIFAGRIYPDDSRALKKLADLIAKGPADMTGIAVGA